MEKIPQSFRKFKKIPLFFSLAFLGVSLFCFFFLYQQISNNQEVSVQMQQQWQTEEARRNQIESQDRLINSTDAERALLESHFAQSSDIVPFLDTIQKLATSVNAPSEILSVEITKDQSPALVVEVKATGTFESVYKFLTLLENSPYELDFVSVDIQNVSAPTTTASGKVASSSWVANFRIKLLSFVI